MNEYVYACMWYECVRAWEVPYGYERGCRGRVLDIFRHVWQSCENGKRLQQTKVQSKPNTTAS